MINKVTITGADDNVKHEDLIKLSQEFPFVEWGILISDSRMGTDRYPQLEWIQTIANIRRMVNHDMRISLHVCGNLCRQILKGEEPDLLFRFPQLIGFFDRAQLNFNIKNYELNYLKFMHLLHILKTNNRTEIIFQYNQSNKAFVEPLIEFGDESWNFLYDASGGRGLLKGDWKEPFKKYTGYAGGLSPDNLEEEIQSIMKVSKDVPVWIDVESGVRTNNKFDLDKVVKFLEISKKYVTVNEYN